MLKLRGKPKPKFKPKAPAKTKVDKRQDRVIRKIVRDYKPEMKYVTRNSDPNLLVLSGTNTMIVTKLSDISQGVNDGERIGNSTLIHRIQVKLVCLPIPSAANTESNFLRIMLVQDLGFNGTDPVGAAILNDYTLTASSWANFLSVTNPDEVTSFKGKRRYKVLADRKILVQGTADDAPIKHIFINKSFKKPINVAYETASNRSNTIFLLVFPGKDTNLAYNPVWVWQAVVKYTDA